MEFFSSTAFAMSPPPAQKTGAPQPSIIEALFPFIIIIAIFYFLVFLPQRKERKKHQEMLNSIKTGDKVITTAGIYGEISKVETDHLIVKVADNVKLKMLKSSISTVLVDTNNNQEKEKK